MKFSNLQLFSIIIFSSGFATAQKCNFINVEKTPWEIFYSCRLVLDSGDSEMVHLPGKVDDDILKILYERDTNSKLPKLENKMCENFRNVEFAEIRHAGIEEVNNNVFEDCINLKVVDFSGNKISDLPENLFAQNLKITDITLGGNRLTTFPESIFSNLTDLDTLTLYENQINLLPPKIFKKLLNLRYLYLGDNKIQTLHPNLFEDLHNLEYLDLNHNEISELPENVFKNLKSLNTLILNKNLIEVVHSESFGILENLMRVELKDNNVTSIDERFVDNTGVSVLLMENNFCTNNDVQSKGEMKKILKKCFENYKPKEDIVQPTSSTTVSIPVECGKPVNFTIGARVIGGAQVGHGEYPWLAILTTSEGLYRCGGSLISKSKIVTAAHCVTSSLTRTPISQDQIKIILGVYDFDDKNETERKIHAVSKIIVHPDWKFLLNSSYDADIAVLELTEEVQFTDYIRPICLMEPFTILETITHGIVVGYGKSENISKEHENIARLIHTPIHNNEQCFLTSEVLTKMSSNRTFCGGYANGTGVCRGDSGSGLIVLHENTYYLRGIVSASLWGQKYECNVDAHAIFTDATKFHNWITTGNLDPEPSKEQKIQTLLHRVLAIADDRKSLELMRNLVDGALKKYESRAVRN